MASPTEFPVTFSPRSVSDTIVGDNSQEGSCKSLENLIFDPSTPRMLNCRPAVRKIEDFSSLVGTSVVSDGIEINGVVYGMISSFTYSGKDQPFAYDISSGTFIPISGVTAATLPVTQATEGDWVPPTMAEVGSRIIVTHPGFAGQYKFGYIDLSGYTATFNVDTTLGSPVLNGSFSIDAIGPGYPISGAGIPAGTTVVDRNNISFQSTGDLHASVTIDNIPTTSGMHVGRQITGNGIPTGTTIASIVSGTSITISQAATATSTGVAIFITGQTITMSANATATANAVSVTVSGGTPGAPLWAAGNTTGNPLVGIPRAVGEFNTRAWFAIGNAVWFTDTLSLNRTNATDILTMGDSTDIVALAPLPVSTTSQGIYQALIAFKALAISQITGDPVTSNLRMDEISQSIGTDSPRSIAQTPVGLMFRANDGIRVVQFTGLLSDPNSDLRVPFIYALHPSRISAGYNTNIYRICVQNSKADGNPFQEYWYDFMNKGWTGPHNFRQDLVLPYKTTFLLFSNPYSPGIFQSDVVLSGSDTFVEYTETEYVAEDGITPYTAEDGLTFYVTESNLLEVDYVAEDGVTPYVAEDGLTNYIAEDLVGVPLNWDFQTVPMTDFGNVYANTILNSTLELALPALGDTLTFTAYDEQFNKLTSATITEQANAPIWDQFTWGLAVWGATTSGIAPEVVPWSQNPVFDRLSVQVSGPSAADLRIGSWHFICQELGYLLHSE